MSAVPNVNKLGTLFQESSNLDPQPSAEESLRIDKKNRKRRLAKRKARRKEEKTLEALAEKFDKLEVLAKHKPQAEENEAEEGHVARRRRLNLLIEGKMIRELRNACLNQAILTRHDNIQGFELC